MSLSVSVSASGAIVAALWAAAAALLAYLCSRPVVGFVQNVLHMKRLTRHLPSPRGSVPILGHVLQIARDPEDFFDLLCRYSAECGPTFGIWLSYALLVVVEDPDDIEMVMTSNLLANKSALYSSFEDFVGKGLLVINGPEHRRHRKVISPFLHLDILQDFVESFDKEGRKMADKMVALADAGDVFDVKPMCGLCSSGSVFKTLLTVDRSDDIDRTAFVHELNNSQDLIMLRIFQPWLLNDWIFRAISSQYNRYMRSWNLMNDFLKMVLGMKIEQQKEKGVAVHQATSGKKRRKAFLDHILSSEEPTLVDEELFQETKLLTIVASNSSKDVLTFACYALAIRPDMQMKLQQEVDAIFGTNTDRPVLPSDLPHLDFTERFIKEVLRYFPVVPLYARAVPEDVKLPSGHTVPKGSNLAFFLPPVHRNPKYFPDPDTFDPDRFLPENSRNRHPFCYLPFSAGVRNCIGSRYAMMFIKTVIANLVRKVRLLPAPDTPKRLEDVRLKSDVGLAIRGDAFIRAERRFPEPSQQ